jgi:hypothetical protein
MMISATEEAFSRSKATPQFILTSSHSPKLQSFKSTNASLRERETVALSNKNRSPSGIYFINKKKKPDYASRAERNNAMHKLDWVKPRLGSRIPTE